MTIDILFLLIFFFQVQPNQFYRIADATLLENIQFMRSYRSLGNVQTGSNFLVLQALATKIGNFLFSLRQMDVLKNIFPNHRLFRNRSGSSRRRFA